MHYEIGISLSSNQTTVIQAFFRSGGNHWKTTKPPSKFYDLLFLAQTIFTAVTVS